MKTLKTITLFVLVGFVGLFGYANIRQLSISEKLKAVHLASFTLKGNLNSEEKLALEKKVSALAGVTACSVNREGNIVSVIFYPEQTNETTLASLLSNQGKLTVTQKQLAISGGCPVHKVNANFSAFVAVLDIRN
ncbi:MAG: hypothetical protein ABI663_10400 [Chryseolinea sp.]